MQAATERFEVNRKDGRTVKVSVPSDSREIPQEAAPVLLEACKYAVAALTQNKTYKVDIDNAVAALRYAIAEATGN